MTTATAPTRQIDLAQEINPCFYDDFYNTDRFLIEYGGSGSGKSVFAAQKTVLRTMQPERSKMVCTRKVARTIKHSVFAEIGALIRRWGLLNFFQINKSDKEFTYLPNGNEIITVGLDDVEKVKSIQGVTSFWHEEATEMTATDLIQLNLRMRGECPSYFQHILTFNPISRMHWLKKRYVDPNRDNTTVHHTTYMDNPHCDDEYAGELEDLIDIDTGFHEIYTLGLWGDLTGLVYKPFLRGPYPADFDEVIYGIDFGYNNPTALIEVGIRDRRVYLTELFYECKYTNGAFIEWMDENGIDKHRCMYGDSAHPDRIHEIALAGYNIFPAHKGQGSVQKGIDFCKTWPTYTNDNNVNLNAENETYKWRVDKDDNPMDVPVDKFNHAMDAVRYALWTHYRPSDEKPLTQQAVLVYDAFQEMGGGLIGEFDGM